MSKNYNKIIQTEYGQVLINIDANSGFCFGVVNAIKKAQQELKNTGSLLSLGNMVHNEEEVTRLSKIGLEAISKKEFMSLKNQKVLFRAHGEPPTSYQYAKDNDITIIDATCPVVLRLQQMIKRAWIESKKNNGQIVIFGKKGHAEVLGLAGQTNNECIIIEDINDVDIINTEKPTVVFSQTTKPVEQYKSLCKKIQNMVNNTVKINDTICRQVSNRAPKLKEFVQNYEVVFFVGGLKSSNANYLFNFCKKHNTKTYFVSSVNDLKTDDYKNKKTIGICGATSTPMWLMQKIAQSIEDNIRISN